MFRGSTKDVHVSAYAHKTLAVDGYAWLHRGVHACATELGRGFGVAVVGLGGHGGGVPRELQALLAGLLGGSHHPPPKRRRSE